VADAKFEEVWRLAFQTDGVDGVKKAASALASMGDISEEAKQQASALLDEIGNVEKTGAAARQYEQVGKQVLEYQHQISAARSKVLELAAAVKASDEPTKAQQRELAKARSTLSELVGEQQRQLTTLRTLKAGLDAQGISTRSAAASQKDLAARTATASANLREMVTRLKATRDADAALQAGLAGAAAKSKAETDQYNASLKKLRQQLDENKAASHAGSGDAVADIEKTRGALDRLREPLAALGAFFSLAAIKDGIKSIFETGGQFAKFEHQLSGLYGTAAQGKSAFEWVKQFTTGTPHKLDEVMSAFVRLKKFGVDPMGGALQALVDQNAKLGGGGDQLQAMADALTKTVMKGKLDVRGLVQLTEAGVPVFDLLAEVMGKSANEVRILAEQGRIGADVMKKLIAQMGKDALGGATDAMGLLSSQWTVLGEDIDDFRDRVARKGVIGWFRDQLKSLNDLIARMAADGRLDVWAQKISDSLISVAKGVKSVTVFLYDHAAAIAGVAKMYATFSVARIAGELAITASRFMDVERAATTSGAKVGIFSKLLGRIPASVQIAIAVVGFDLLVKTGNYIGEFAGKHSAAAKSLEATQQRINAQIRKQAESYMDAEQQYSRYYDTQVLGAQETAKLTAAERAGYAERLAGLRAYLTAKASAERRLVELGEMSQVDLDKTLAALRAAKDGVTSLQQGADLAAAAIKAKLSVSAEALREQLVDIGNDATTAQARVGELFASFQGASITAIGDIALALANVAGESQAADKAVRLGLVGTLGELSSTDLLKFQSAATAAFDEFKTGAKDSAAVTETVLQVALQRLGVAADQWGLASTDAAQQNVAAFQTVAENAAATAGTIEAAFNKALAGANTEQAVQDLGTAMQVAGQQGKVGFDATERAAAAMENRIRALKAALDPLNAAFAQLGITSKRSLDNAAAASRTSFDQIVKAYRGGHAAIEDVRAAFGAYAKTQLDAEANSDSWRQSSVRNSLQVQAATLSVSDEMAKLGLAGLDTGDKITHGARQAEGALRDTSSAAADAADATQEAGDRAESYAEKLATAHDENAKKWVATGKRTQVAMTGFSNTFLDALAKLNNYASTPHLWMRMWNDTVADWQRQTDSLDAQLDTLNKQNAVYDELGKRVGELRQQYKYLTDEQLRGLAAAEKQLADNKKRAADEARQKAKDAREKNAAANAADTERWNKELGLDKSPGAPTATAPNDVHRIALDLNVSAKQVPGAVPAQLSPTDVQRLANEVVRQITISRTMSNH
jgi:tape measure domain-containing protein